VKTFAVHNHNQLTTNVLLIFLDSLVIKLAVVILGLILRIYPVNN